MIAYDRAGLQAAQSDRAVRQPAQAVPPRRNPLRNNRQGLSFNAMHCSDKALDKNRQHSLGNLGGSLPRGALELPSDPELGPPPFPRSSAGPAALRADMSGLKNIIPPRHADPEATCRIAEMVQHVETPESQAQTGLGLAMMHIVMHHVIGEIADDKTHQHRIPERQAE